MWLEKMKCIGRNSVGHKSMDRYIFDQVIQHKKHIALYFSYCIGLKKIEVILTVVSNGTDTRKSSVREFKSSELHVIVQLSALFPFLHHGFFQHGNF